MKRFLLGAIFFLLVFRSYGQLTSCAQTLRLAQSTYEQGRLHEVPTLLQNCLANASEKDFSKANRVAAYKLLVLSYIYLEEPEKANEAMLNLLRTDHYFEINPSTDPAEFIALYNTFRTQPVYRIGGKLGVNATLPNVVKAVEANEGKSEYTSKIGFQLHAVGEIPVAKNLTLSPELGFIQRSFGYKNTVSFTDTTFTTNATEKQVWISLPVSIQYQFSSIKFKPYVAIGFETDYLLNSSFVGSRTRQGYQFIEEKSFDLKPYREKLNFSVLAAGGVHIPLSGGLITAEVRVLYGITPVNSENTAFSVDPNLPFEYGYADSLFKLNSISITAGYVYNIFNPKKLNSRK